MASGIQIDQLIVSLGLDATKFTQGQAQAVAAFKNLQQNANKQAKAFEESANRIINFMSRLRAQAIGFAAAAFGAHGIGEFIIKTTASNAALDRTARALGTTAEKLNQWREAAVLAGGSAEGIQGSIAGLVSEIQNFALTGQSQMLPFLRALGVQGADAKGKLKDFDTILLEIAEALKGKTPQERLVFGQRFGISQADILMLSQGASGLQVLLDKVKELNNVTAEQAARSEALRAKWAETALAARGLGNAILDKLTPALTAALDTMTLAFKSWVKDFTTPGPVDRKARMAAAFAAARGVVGTVSPGAGDVKAGAGNVSAGMGALAASLRGSVPGIDRFTSFDDALHKGTGSKHEQGLALDFTLKDPKQAAATAAAIRARLASMGVNATVLDEYTSPSKGSTGGHIHVQFNNQAAADRFRAGAGSAAAVGPAAGAGGGGRTEVNINEININAPGADSAEIGRNVANSLRIRLRAFTGNAQAGAS